MMLKTIVLTGGWLGKESNLYLELHIVFQGLIRFHS
jgi:hypothetical protein